MLLLKKKEWFIIKGYVHVLPKYVQAGEMAEWSKAVASKAIIPCEWDRGFKSPSLLQSFPKEMTGCAALFKRRLLEKLYKQKIHMQKCTQDDK